MNPAPSPGTLPLDGVRVVLLRSAERSGPMIWELHSRGADVRLLPLIDFETPEDIEAFDASLESLAGGGFSWLVITSITTIRALKQRVAERGSHLTAAIHPGTQIAAVGEATADALFAEGLRVDLVPGRIGKQSSAAGLAAAFSELPPDGRVLVPQADRANDTVERLLADQGWDLECVTAYRTVALPADPARRITAGVAQEPGSSGSRDLPAAETLVELDRGQFWAAAAAGDVDAVVFTSPSTVRLLSDGTLTDAGGYLPAGVAAVMIGASTADEAARCGIPVAAVAAEPTPVGIADAIAAAVRNNK